MVVDIAFIILASLGLGQMAFPVAEAVAADTAALTDILQVAFVGDPAHFGSLRLGDEIGRQMAIGVNV